MSRGRRHHPLWSRCRVLVTPQGSAVANAIQSLLLTPTTMLLTLRSPLILSSRVQCVSLDWLKRKDRRGDAVQDTA